MPVFFFCFFYKLIFTVVMFSYFFKQLDSALKNSDMNRCIKYYQEFIYTIASYHDKQNENSIQAFRSLAGMLLLVCAHG